MATYGWKYKTGERVNVGDYVKVSKKIANIYNNGNQAGVVVDLRGFITVQLTNGVRVDCDARQVTFVSIASSNHE